MKRVLACFLIVVMLLSGSSCTSCCSIDENTISDITSMITENITYEVTVFEDDGSEASSPLLYCVEDESGGICWLFGSVHVGIDEMYPLPDYVVEAYYEADSLAVECDIVAAEMDVTGMMTVLQDMMYQDGTTIADHIPADLYEEAKEILEENNTYSEALDYYYPSLWSSFIDNFSITNYGYDSQNGIDMNLIKLAKNENKPLLEIESVEFQFNMLASFSPELQEVLLEGSVASYNSDESREAMDALVKAWYTGDEQELTALLSEESDEPLTAEEEALLKEYNDAMLTDRNIAMTDFAEDALKSGDQVFICVGAAHIVGEGAMVDLLKERGYDVQRVQ